MTRRGFTLIELFVVIAIIGVLIALLLPAVQAAREAARRVQCQNNLKQIGLALHNYHDVHRSFPMSTTAGAPSDAGCGNGFFSWMALILPQMEQAPLHDSIDFRIGMSDSCAQGSSSDYQTLTLSASHPNAAAAATVVSSYLCPSDGYGESDVMGSAHPAPGSYAGNVGWPLGASWPDGGAPIQKHNGFMGLANPRTPAAWHVSAVSMRDLIDGTSNTAAVAERLIFNANVQSTPFGEYMGANVPESVQTYCGGSTGTSRPLDRWIRYCGGVTVGDARLSKPHGRAWISGWTFNSNSYMHVFPPNERNCHLYGGEGDGTNIVTASSRHTGGANMLLGDGHVRFISESIDMRIWWALGSRDGGEAQGLQ